MPRLRTIPDSSRYTLGCLFGRWEDVAPTPAATPGENSPRIASAGRSPAKPAKLRVSKYGGSQGRGDAAQQVATVREVLLARLDDLGATHLWPIAKGAGLSHGDFLTMFNEMLLCLFPAECGDGEEYTPDPECRQNVPPGVKVRKGGLFPYPCEGVGDERSLAFAQHLLIGEASPVAKMTTADGGRMFTDAELARLGERVARRAAHGRVA